MPSQVRGSQHRARNLVRKWPAARPGWVIRLCLSLAAQARSLHNFMPGGRNKPPEW